MCVCNFHESRDFFSTVVHSYIINACKTLIRQSEEWTLNLALLTPWNSVLTDYASIFPPKPAISRTSS